MGALYVKDDEALAMAEELAARRGVTKVAAVKLALANELERDKPKRSVHEIVEDLRRTSAYTYDPDVVIDKGFWDSLYEDDE
jgi:antitoxin VapB